MQNLLLASITGGGATGACQSGTYKPYFLVGGREKIQELRIFTTEVTEKEAEN
jgi:hypothetical protein